jgi:vitamin-K-epoxide reductase (warfarin-sensitive)
MRYLIMVLALAGIVISAITLGIHYSAEFPPTNSRSHWNSSAVNHSPYSVVAGVPVSVLGIVEYSLLGLLAYLRQRVLTTVASMFGLAYAIYLTNIEAHILNLWCVYCLCSLIFMVLITLLAFGQLIFNRDN